ncbi:MAG: phosphate ABC transporter ATP-binding protein [Gammaproteobacteria bacterium]
MAEGGQAVRSASTEFFEARGLSVQAGTRCLLRNVNLAISPHQVFGLMGPSGAGKSTLLRCLNRLIDLTPTLRVSGEVLFHGHSIRAPGVDVDALHARIGMLFQQPVVFPKSIFQNIIFGIRHLGRVPRRLWSEVAERALREAVLWDEVKDRLHEPALRLSVGQQQRLCLARTLAVDPEVILLDEPTSALDARSTEAIEALILKLRETRTIVLVTHNLGQARRVADYLACVAVRGGAGEIIEVCRCNEFMQGVTGEELADLVQSAGGS